MDIPDMVGQSLEDGLEIINGIRGIDSKWDIVITEYSIPQGFHKKIEAGDVKRIIRQDPLKGGGIKLVVSAFLETIKQPPLDIP